MNAPLAQIVALTCHGNAVLQRRAVSASFFPANSTCAFCDRVTFVLPKRSLLGRPQEKVVAPTPGDWFHSLKSSGATGIRLIRAPENRADFPDRILAGIVGGGGTWQMEVLQPDQRSAFWTARWEVWNQDAPEQRIWRVTYARTKEAATAPAVSHDLDEHTARLVQALTEIHGFTAQHDCDWFTQRFADALDTLKSKGQHRHGYHQDLAPDGFLPRKAQSLLDACQSAWVFGGMGSWNDMSFDGEEQVEYDRVSEQLFQTVCAAICAACSCPVSGPATPE